MYLSAGLLCAALCWMLQGWVSPGWALLAALLFVCRVGVLSYWMNSYMGTAVPESAGRWRWVRWLVFYGEELSAMQLHGPWDSRCWCFRVPTKPLYWDKATGALVLWFLLKSHTPWNTICVRVAVPALSVFTMCLAAVGYNDYRVTGSALTLPYQVHDQQYVIASMFTFVPLSAEPHYRHPVMRRLWADKVVGLWTNARGRPLAVLLGKLYVFDTFFFSWWVLWIPVLLCPYDLVTPQERATVFLLLVLVLAVAPLIAVEPHYAASFAGVFYVRVAQSLTRLASWRPWGKALGRALGILLVGLLVGSFCNSVFGLVRNGKDLVPFASGRDPFSGALALREATYGAARRSVIQALEKQPGRQLVMLRYAAEHDPENEWVYNRADIDGSSIVWAREMSPEEDRPFLEHFRDRKVWLLEPDQSPPKLSRYP